MKFKRKEQQKWIFFFTKPIREKNLQMQTKILFFVKINRKKIAEKIQINYESP